MARIESAISCAVLPWIAVSVTVPPYCGLATRAAAVEDSETDDAAFEPAERLEEQEEPDSGDIRK